MASLRKNGKTINSSEREIIRKIIKKCDEEAEAKEYKFPVQQRNRRAAWYAGIGERSITKIRKESRETGEERLSTPGKKRPKPETRRAIVDNFDMMVIKNTVRDFYLIEKKVPTCIKLLSAVKEKITFPWGVDILRRCLKQLGFKWKKCIDKRKVLIERPEIVNWRWRYLNKIRKIRSGGKKLIYIDETWIDNNLTHKTCWQSDEIRGVATDTSAGNRLIVVAAGSETGFVKDSVLVFKAGQSTGDYHGQMDGRNFEMWIRQKLIPNLEPGTVIVLDNASYHSVQENKPPTKYSLKSDMVKWLENNNVPFQPTMRKPELMSLVDAFKSQEKVYRIDTLLSSAGHSVIRLPPYHCDLNAIELAWSKIKRLIKDQNIKGDFSLKLLKEKAEEAIEAVSERDWQGYCNHVKSIEEDYWEKDGVLEEEMEQFVIQLSDQENSSDSEGEPDDINIDDEELARPLDSQ